MSFLCVFNSLSWRLDPFFQEHLRTGNTFFIANQ
jgi:hypothetical protein